MGHGSGDPDLAVIKTAKYGRQAMARISKSHPAARAFA
jgi:hypothetical protein